MSDNGNVETTSAAIDPLKSARRGIDVIAITLCAIGSLIAFSLFSQSGSARFMPATALDWEEFPAYLRHGFFESLGLAAYFFPGAWLIVALTRFRRPRWPLLFRRILGWAILVGGAAVVADQFGAQWNGPIIGNGGSIGAAGSLALHHKLSPVMGLLALAGGMAIGLFLAADGLVRRLWRLTVRIVRAILGIVEWLVRHVAMGLEGIALVLHWVARSIDRRLHPERYPVVPAKPRAAEAPVPILDHRKMPPLDLSVAPELPAPSISFPRAERDEDTAPPQAFDLPSLDLLEDPVPVLVEHQEQKLRDMAAQLEKACADFGLTVRVAGIHTGPVITQYEISLETGLRVSKITSLSDDLALHLKVPSVRIVAPIPGKNTVGIEVPNEHRAVVRLKELMTIGSPKLAKMKLPLFLGKDSEGRPLIHDLADMPHLLVAGRTGTGKSVCLNSIILSMLLTRSPDECKLIMLDPKQVELADYGRLPHLMHPVVTDNKKAEAILSWAVDKMEERYEILRRARVRNIASYNELKYAEILRRVRPIDDDEQQRVPERMPYIVVVVDEVGDLMMAMKKEVEGHIIRLAQKSRAAGIHLILTTQRPTVDVITGLIKSNLPARICFQVADRSNSRVVLDEMGAEKLLGKGDMLFLQPNTSTIVRAQGTYASDEEIQRIVGRLEVESQTFDSELMNLEGRTPLGKNGMMEVIRKRDDLYEEAIEIVVRESRGSVSLLQRALGIGYGRAARLVDFMAEDGIVGHYNGAQAREVLFTMEQWEAMKRGATESPLAESA
jgi:S-DNA-T family DNA segregation ATPase FtsK/SpoIIIE